MIGGEEWFMVEGESTSSNAVTRDEPDDDDDNDDADDTTESYVFSLIVAFDLHLFV